MTDVPDSLIAIMAGGITVLLPLVYFYVNRKDKKVYENRTEKRDEGEEERAKLALADKVKKDLQDEAEKVESSRKDIATFVKQETHEFVEQKIKELIMARDHIIQQLEQKIDTTIRLSEQSIESRFKASDLIMTQLLQKMVDIAKVQGDAMNRINDAIEKLQQLFYELTGKVAKVKEEVDTKQSKRSRDTYGNNGNNGDK